MKAEEAFGALDRGAEAKKLTVESFWKRDELHLQGKKKFSTKPEGNYSTAVLWVPEIIVRRREIKGEVLIVALQDPINVTPPHPARDPIEACFFIKVLPGRAASRNSILADFKAS